MEAQRSNAEQVLPITARRQTNKTKPSSSTLDRAINIPKIIPAIRLKNSSKASTIVSNHQTTTQPLKSNHSSLLDDKQWEEIGDILRPGLPFQFNNNSTAGKNSTNIYAPQPHHSLMVLLVCLSVLFFSFLVLGCKYWWENRRRRGYSPAPNISPDDDHGRGAADEVIAEIVNRREQVPVKLPKPQSNASTIKQSSPTSKAAISQSSMKQSTSSRVTVNDPTRNQLTDDEMQLIIGNQTLVNNATQPASCPLNEAKHVKLIPIENLVVPRTFSDAIQQAYPCMAIPPSHLDIDKVLSLTKVEKSQSHADLVLKPIPSGSRNRVIFMEPDIEEAKLFSGPSGYPMPPAPPMDQRDDLTLEQRKEEQNKFLRACWRNEMRRRRSLCSISSNDDLVDAELYNSILKKAKMNSARKVKSMPTMVIQPFGRVPSFTTTYSTDALGDSPILSPPTPLGSDGSSSQRSTNFSRSSSMGSFHDDWKNAMKSESYSRKAFRISNEGTRHTSKTSIWSTVASENAADVVQESEDDETDRWDAPPPNVPAIINFLEAPSHNNSVNATAGNADEDEDDPGDTLSPQLLESKPSIGRKQSLTALDFIVKSVKSVGYAPKKDDSIRSMTPLESDQLPSGIFVPVTKSKTSSELLGEESSITHLFQQSPHSFWSTSIQSPSIKRVSS